jgi:peptide-methionine (S)-S-oxide reductase
MIYNGEEISIASLDTATFGGGCFWCVEVIFQQLKGVIKVTPGYSGGHVKNPSYREVCSGITGHAEVCQIIFNPHVISYEELLEVFFVVHDPTTLNRQGNDIGTQYRSVILYHNQKQKSISLEYQKMIDKSGAYDKPLVTEISSFTAFYKAEDYHQGYYKSNKMGSYCSCIIAPKLEKFRKVFRDKLKVAVLAN